MIYVFFTNEGIPTNQKAKVADVSKFGRAVSLVLSLLLSLILCLNLNLVIKN